MITPELSKKVGWKNRDLDFPTFQKMPEYQITIDNLEDMLRKELNKNK
jgi:hypothetical protein